VTAVDFHQHLWPEPFVAALRRRSTPPMLLDEVLVTREGAFPIHLRGHHPWTRIAALDAAGLDLAVLSLQPSLGLEALPADQREALEQAWIDGIREVLAASGGRLAALAPGRVLDGFLGTSAGVSVLLDDLTGAGSPVLAEVDAAGGLLFVHPEAEPGPAATGRPDWWNWMVGYTGQMQAGYLAWLSGGRQRRPAVRIVFALLAGGAPFQHERLAHRGVDLRSQLDPGVFFDTASYGRRAIELCIESFGVEALVYGSDQPVIDPGPTLTAVHGFGSAVARFLTVDNPGRLLPMPEPSRRTA
jgi:6-methylsalicylate decarboxylase